MRIRSLAEFFARITSWLDLELEKGYDLHNLGDYMKFAHALQLQAQALIDMAQRAAALLEGPPRSYVEAGEILLNRNVFTSEEFSLYKAVVGFRNVLVHNYLAVDIGLIDRILKRREYKRLTRLVEKLVRIDDP